MSLIHKTPPQNEKDAEVKGLGIVSKQDYKVPAGFHSSNALIGYMKRMFKTSFEDRYLIMIPVNSFANNTEQFINFIENSTEAYKEKTKVYNRTTNACTHPALEILAKIPAEELIEHESIDPQRAAIIVIEELFKKDQQTLKAFKKAKKSSGLNRFSLELGEIIENNLKKNTNNDVNTKPRI